MFVSGDLFLLLFPWYQGMLVRPDEKSLIFYSFARMPGFLRGVSILFRPDLMVLLPDRTRIIFSPSPPPPPPPVPPNGSASLPPWPSIYDLAHQI